MSDVGRSNIQSIFAIEEDTPGILKVPDAVDAIIAAGEFSGDQIFPVSDSEEILQTLDVLERFKNAAEPAKFSFPMYLRLPDSANLGDPIQGDILFKSLLGSVIATGAVTLAVNNGGGWGDSDTDLVFDSLADGWLPDMGTIICETEQIFYRGITWTSDTEGTLHNCERGYNSTTAATHADDVAASLKSRFFKQNITSPSFSIFAQLDHFTYQIAGCTTGSKALGLNNEGGCTFNVEGQGMRLFWAGTDALTALASAGQADIDVNDARQYSEGAYIKNIDTSNDGDNGGAGFLITAINKTTNKITLGTNIPVGGWAQNDEIVGFVPSTITSIPNVLESVDTLLWVDDVQTVTRTTDLTINCPKTYPNDQIGDKYPTFYAEGKREISSSYNGYFKKQDAKFFSENQDQTIMKYHILLGNAEGQRLAITLRKVTMSNIQLGVEEPMRSISADLSISGILDNTTNEVGENSIELCSC